MKDYILRAKIEEKDEFKKWMTEIPVLSFPSNWKVKIIPPFHGAIVRFLVFDQEEKQRVSVYLDCYDRLGYFGEPYWEIHPYDNDVYRIKMQDADELLKRIQEILDGTDNYS